MFGEVTPNYMELMGNSESLY